SAMRWLGVRSYSIYLWHWPAISLLYFAVQHWPSPVQLAFAMIATLFLADISYRWIEQPVRQRWVSWSHARQITNFAALGAAMCSIGGALYFAQGLPQRFTSAGREAWTSASD